MNQQVFGAYLIVKILSKNRNDLDKYECVPNTWVKVEDNYDDTVVFGYPKEDRLVTRLRIIECQPLDTTWPIIFGKVVFDTDSQEDAFQILKRKNEHETITDLPKDSGKQDNKEVKSTTSKTIELKPNDQNKKKRGRPRKQKKSDQASIQSKDSEDKLKKKIELEISEVHLSDGCLGISNEDFGRSDQMLPNETDNALEETLVNNTACKVIKRRKCTRQTKNLSEGLMKISEKDFDRSDQILPNQTDNALEETQVNNIACKVTERRKSTRHIRNLPEGHLGISDEHFDISDQILANDNALEEIPVSETACKIIKRPRRKCTRQTRNLSEGCLGISNEGCDRSDQMLPNETYNALEETLINNTACKVIKRRKCTRQTKNLSVGLMGISDEDFDRSDQILPNQTDNALEETQVNNIACKVTERRKSTRHIRNLPEGHLGISDEHFDISDQLLPNDNALEGTPVSNTACKIIKRPRRTCTRKKRNLSVGCLGISNEGFDRSDQMLPNETDNALEESTACKVIKRRKCTRQTRNLSEGQVNNIACKVTERKKSTRHIRNLPERHLGISDEHFDRSDQILPSDNALVGSPVSNTACKIIKRPRRKCTHKKRNLSVGCLGISNDGFDRSDQMLPNETDNALEEITACKVIKRRKCTHQTRNLSEGQVNNIACKVTERRKSNHHIRNLPEGHLGISDEHLDRSNQILPNDNALEERPVSYTACKIINRRKSTRQTGNLSEGYLEFSNEHSYRSHDSDCTPGIVHPPLPDLPRPSRLSIPVREQDIINMNLLNDQVYYECYNFYIEFKESYRKSMSILENAEDYLQNITSTHKDKVAVKEKPPPPSPLYQELDALSPTAFTHPQLLLQERSTSSISEEDTTWTVRYPEPGPGLIELMPNTGVYVSEKGLNRCKSTISETTKFTRALLTEVFTDEALRNCSFTGVSRRKIRKNPNKTPKPGLDPKTRETFLDYLLKYSLNMGWEKADPAIIMNCIKNRLEYLHRSA